MVVAIFKEPVATCGEWRQGVNFIHILQAAFKRIDPKSTKKTDILTAYFALSENMRAVAARRTLMKLTQGWTTLL